MSTTTRRIIVSTSKAPGSIGPYNQAVLVDKTLYISGQVGFIPATMELVTGGVQDETRQALTNMGEVLRAAGGNFNNVVKTTVLLQSMNDFVKVNEIYKTFFRAGFEPARAAYQVAALPRGALVEIEAVAIIGDIVDEEQKSKL